MKQRNKTVIGFKIKEVIIIIVIVSIISALTTGIILSNNYRTDNGMSYYKLLEDKNVKDFLNVYANVLNGYYEDVDSKEAIESAIDGMMSYLGDKYTTYMDDDQAEALASKLKGEYQGIGVSVNQEAIIVDVFEDSPAQNAGIEPNDQIVEVNGTEINEKNFDKVSEYIQSSGEEVTLKIKRNSEYKTFKLKLAKLFVPAIHTTIIDFNNKKIGYMYISSFSSTLTEQVSKALSKYDGIIDSLIVDVRSNSGGYLKTATDTASLFLEKDKIIYILDSKEGRKEYKDETDERKTYPIVVLTNSGTASAAEILTAALKDSYGATIVGTKTYGKGKVQETYSLDDGTMVKYTSAKWLRPNGEGIDEVGIEPDYYVALQKNDKGELVDTQLDKAIEIIGNM